MYMKSDIVICGAGIAGVSAAYSLAVEKGVGDILLVDEGAPLSLTSDHSTECYRNWWPDEAMVALMNRSIDRLEMLARRSGNLFHLNRRGYLYCTADPNRAAEMERNGKAIARNGAGELRIHRAGDPAGEAYSPAAAEGFEEQPDGADLLLDAALIREHFPYLAPEMVAALHVRRAGWFSAQQLGMYMLDEARRQGVRLVSGKITGVELAGGRVQAVKLADGSRIETPIFVDAAGPFLKPTARLVEADLPVYNELHLKLAMKDVQGVLDRKAPLVVLTDPQKLEWSGEEVEWLQDDPGYACLLDELPGGLHTRPEGGRDSPIILVLWEYQTHVMEPAWPLPEDPIYPDVLLRGLPKLLPGMTAYINKAGKPRIDGGYYTRTIENRPLIDRLPVDGAFVSGALSGFGLMAACAAGELLANYVTGETLPAYAPAFSLNRYQDPEYQTKLAAWGESGQL